jgi:hypothetical protein
MDGWIENDKRVGRFPFIAYSGAKMNADNVQNVREYFSFIY